MNNLSDWRVPAETQVAGTEGPHAEAAGGDHRERHRAIVHFDNFDTFLSTPNERAFFDSPLGTGNGAHIQITGREFPFSDRDVVLHVRQYLGKIGCDSCA